MASAFRLILACTDARLCLQACKGRWTAQLPKGALLRQVASYQAAACANANSGVIVCT
jgi:hypothetical protein